MQTGDVDSGWKHVQSRHIDGTYRIDSEDATGFFPVGQRVKGRELSDTLTRDDVIELQYAAIERGQVTAQGTKTRYYSEPSAQGHPESGIDEMRVVVDDSGRVETAYPMSGDDVLRWIPDLDGGAGGFIHTS